MNIVGDGEVSLGNLLIYIFCSRFISCGLDLFLFVIGVGVLLWLFIYRFEGVIFMGVFVEEEVVAGSISGYSRG